MLPSIEATWNTRPLGELCTIIMGQAPKGDTYNHKGIGTPLIAGAADLGQITPMPKKWTTSPTKLSVKDDIILCVRATIGDLNWADSEYCYGRGVCGIRVNSQIYPQFLWFWLEACKKHLLSLGRGATFKQISKTDIAGLPIPDLDITAQRRIVARIKECMERVEEIEVLRGKAIKESEYLHSAVFADYVESLDLSNIGDSVIGDVVIESKYGTSKKANTTGKGCPVIRMGNIQGGRLDVSNLKHIELPQLEKRKYLLQEGDILVNRTNSLELVGKSAVFKGLTGEWLYASYLVRFRIDKKKAIPEYVNAVINSRIGRSYVYKTARRAIGMVNINAKEIQRLPLPLPTVEEQESLIDKMNEAEPAIEELYGLFKEDGIVHLRESILHKAFAGEL